MLHGQLGCAAFLHHVRRSGAPYCEAPGCVQQHQLETLTHAFLECPDVAPVVDWLLATWEQLAGPQAAVPRTAAFLLADDPAGWGAAATPGLYRMWTRLRVATLGAIWDVRCHRHCGAVGASFASRVVAQATRTLVTAIQRDWLRTGASLGTTAADGAHGDVRWWDQCRISHGRFERLWAKPAVFCSVVRSPAGPPALVIRLGRDRPVAAPP